MFLAISFAFACSSILHISTFLHATASCSGVTPCRVDLVANAPCLNRRPTISSAPFSQAVKNNNVTYTEVYLPNRSFNSCNCFDTHFKPGLQCLICVYIYIYIYLYTIYIMSHETFFQNEPIAFKLKFQT